jgi:hypothetical protein
VRVSAAVLRIRDHDDRALLCEVVANATKQAMREYALLEQPGCIHEIAPPTALEHERRIIGALLNGTIALDDLVPVAVRDFFLPLSQAVAIAIEVLGENVDTEITITRIVMALRAQGFAGNPADILNALEAFMASAVAPFDLNDAKSEVIETAHVRRLLKILQQASADLRLGHRTAGQVVSALREVELA